MRKTKNNTEERGQGANSNSREREKQRSPTNNIHQRWLPTYHYINRLSVLLPFFTPKEGSGKGDRLGPRTSKSSIEPP